MVVSSDLSQLVVLVVEDEPLLRLFLAYDMSDRGWRVYEAADAIEALHLLERHPDIELVFTELRMPGMNGVELLRIVHERWPQILLMATSGHRQLQPDELPDDARFVAKPVDSSMMMRAIQSLVDVHGRGR
jgi:CheY-like chemotaxis protein